MIVTSVQVNGSQTRLLGGNPSRVALVFFTPNNAVGWIGPLESLTADAAMFALGTQHPVIVKIRQYGNVLGEEWWYNGVNIGLVNCVEIF